METDRREWNIQKLRGCMYLHDIEVLKIRLSERTPDDTIAWHYETTGIFTVKSAYRLAQQEDQAERRQTGSSTMPDGRRTLYKGIWATPVRGRYEFLLGGSPRRDYPRKATGSRGNLRRVLCARYVEGGRRMVITQ
jgi:hypothetical protein